jgi:hypothetical protein
LGNGDNIEEFASAVAASDDYFIYNTPIAVIVESCASIGFV